MRMIGFVSGVAMVLGLAVSAGAQGQQTKGTLMDIACSSHHATEAGYTESHDKKCLLMESCVKSGYSLVTADKKVLKFDKKGNDLALELIKKADRDKDWKVAVDGKVMGDTIAVSNITLQ
ncbi:MAG: hypothetical protein AB7H96_11785 [Vicinamibacterales bacterium]